MLVEGSLLPRTRTERGACFTSAGDVHDNGPINYTGTRQYYFTLSTDRAATNKQTTLRYVWHLYAKKSYSCWCWLVVGCKSRTSICPRSTRKMNHQNEHKRSLLEQLENYYRITSVLHYLKLVKHG